MRRVRAQAAMEFLMTYGWAVLIMLVVIAVLFYLGVFGQSTQVPKSCTFPAGFTCAEFFMDETGMLQLDLGQATGKQITVTGIGCSAASTPTITSLSTPVTIRNGAHAWVTNASGIPCAGAAAPAFRGKIVVSYTMAGSPLARNATGQLSYPISVGGADAPTPMPVIVLNQSNLPYTVTSPGTYLLDTNVDAFPGPGTAPVITVVVQGSNSTIDCQGHSIYGRMDYQTLIKVYFASGVTIKNCVLYSYGGAHTTGIEFEQGSDSVIRDNVISDPTNIVSVYLWRDSYRNQLINNQATVIQVGYWARHNVLTGNTACAGSSNLTCDSTLTNTTGSGNQCSSSSCAGAPCNSAC